MCLAIPARLVELLPGEQAIVNLGGIRKTVSIALIDHVGHAIGKIDPKKPPPRWRCSANSPSHRPLTQPKPAPPPKPLHEIHR
ncbi:MAG: HypC/HybG/HupF family hydrogenase formation chaperone [Polaromonas sp.]|nr:HypC/HybG/HupF family hydrogenase formation chaperone [Polaromonas sp.]